MQTTPSVAHIVLASGSETRARLLRAAALAFSVEPANIDEARLRDSFGGDAVTTAVMLAERKAMQVSQNHPSAVVIGSDQVLALGARQFGKPGTRAKAREQLRTLRGQTHSLCTAVALAQNGRAVWSHREVANLRVRALTDAEIDAYLERAGDAVLGAPGAYHVEGLGITLFDKVAGDYFGILGMPLVPLLKQLRHLGVPAAS